MNASAEPEKQSQNKPNQTQPVVSLSNLFQTGYLTALRSVAQSLP